MDGVPSIDIYVDLRDKVSMVEDGEESSSMISVFKRRGRKNCLTPIRHSMKMRPSLVWDKIPWNSKEEIVKGLELEEIVKGLELEEIVGFAFNDKDNWLGESGAEDKRKKMGLVYAVIGLDCFPVFCCVGRWKADNGTFKPGFLQQIEKMMSDKIPGCGLRAQPHIDSRIKLLKKQYHAISEMLGPSASGFGWNDDLKCVVVEKNVFDEWVKVQWDSLKRLRRLAMRMINIPFYPLDELNGTANMSSTSTPLTQSSKKGKKRSMNEDPIVDFLKDSVKEFGNMQTAASDSIKRLAVFNLRLMVLLGG
ncbi:hypothetical protein Ddye_027521 [Dipteronia dyeriana]|uniref:Myb/SANT-like domain-containing protein n=1 Tax=Dipteronia dyeriana TaxID=168575 RepID=A0AAD9TPX6_9ROSI|nr:hypothetical protein Ddye_027521 [Dipteronia dyeriana]